MLLVLLVLLGTIPLVSEILIEEFNDGNHSNFASWVAGCYIAIGLVHFFKQLVTGRKKLLSRAACRANCYLDMNVSLWCSRPLNVTRSWQSGSIKHPSGTVLTNARMFLI